jgi:hypothetical protein
LESIKFAKGVLGHTSWTIAFVFAAMAVTVWSLSNSPLYALIGVVIEALFACIFLLGSWWFAERNPAIALLEGANLVRWRELDMAAQGLPHPDQTNIQQLEAVGAQQLEAGDDA